MLFFETILEEDLINGNCHFRRYFIILGNKVFAVLRQRWLRIWSLCFLRNNALPFFSCKDMREGVSLSLPVNLFICSASSFLFKMSFIFHGRLPFCLLALAFVVVQTRLAAKRSKGRHHMIPFCQAFWGGECVGNIPPFPELEWQVHWVAISDFSMCSYSRVRLIKRALSVARELLWVTCHAAL